MRKRDAAIPLLSSADINKLGIMMHTIENNAGTHLLDCGIKVERSDQVCSIPAANKEFQLALNTDLH